MNLVDWFLFPAPSPSYDWHSFPNQLFWIPSQGEQVPALLVQSCPAPRMLILYCHGNAEDLGKIHPTLTKMSETLNAAVIAFEYPGYGLCSGKLGSCSVDKLEQVSRDVYRFCTLTLRVPPRKIVLFGRSLGSGPATMLASGATRPRALVLVSAYTSINDIARRFVGQWVAHSVLKRRFANIELMGGLKSPLLLIHGMRDEVVGCSHSAWLYEAAGQLGEEGRRLHLVQDKSHNGLSLSADILGPMQLFLRDTKTGQEGGAGGNGGQNVGNSEDVFSTLVVPLEYMRGME